MLYLYDKNTIYFTNNGEPIRHSYDEHVIREDGFYLTFKLLLDINSDYKKVKKEMIVSAETPDGRNQFRIYDIVKRKDHVEVVAVQLMYDLDNKMVNPFKVNNVSGTTVINRFISSFKSSLGAFTLSSSVAETHDFSTNDENDDTPSQNALEVLNRITNRWDSELLVNGYDIRMIKRLGTRTNALLYEKKNISNFEDESTVRNMATRIHATSRFIAEGDDEETVISVSVDSPLINEYAQVYEKSFVNNDARTTQELVNWVNLKYSTENIDKPKRNINVSTNIIDGTEINYGDELVLKYLVHDVDEVIRCVGYDYNPVAQTYYSIVLGDWKDSFATTLTGGIVDTTQRQINQIKKNVTHILTNADGYHRNAQGPDPVPNPINGDIWYYFEWDRPKEIELRIFEDGFWVPVPFGTKAEVEAAISEAESAKQAAEQAYSDSVAEAERLIDKQTVAFDAEMDIRKDEINAVKNDINLRVTKGEVVSQLNIDAGRVLIQTNKLLLDANTYIMGTAFVTDLKAKSIEAVTANITSIRAQILVADSVTSTHIKAENALIDSLFSTTALITRLTSKTAFITNIKAIDISADKVTTGTLNAANVNIINLNVSKIVGLNSTFIQSQWNLLDATTSITGTGLVSQQGALSTRLTGGEIATVSGTKTGKINALGMEIYDSANGQTTRLHSDGLEFNWYGIKRVFEQNSEGVTIRPITGSGNRLNSSLHITTGPGADKVAYIDFNNPSSGRSGRIILDGLDIGVRHPDGGVVQIANYANDGRAGNLRAGTFQTSTYDGRGLRIVESQINTLAGNQTLYIMPSGTGELRIGSGGSNPVLWPVRASRFVEGSSRASKTNINPYVGSALDEIKNLQAVTFNRKEDVTNGINYMSLGFIAEDSPFIAIQQPDAPLGVDHYKMVTLAIKGVQELVSITDKHTSDILRIDTFIGQHEQEIQQLKQKIAELERKIA